MPNAIILLSGGLDSTTCLAFAKNKGYELHALSFDYGQRHRQELHAAKAIAKVFAVKSHQWVNIDLNSIGGSALTDLSISVPESEVEFNPELHSSQEESIPITYVPARNTIFLAYALAMAEVLDCKDIFIGVNAVDYSGYPDCRPEFISAFTSMANLATKAGVEGRELEIHTPLIDLSKAEIIQLGTKFKVDYGSTISCYQVNSEGQACGKCDSCRFRKQGFKEAGISDPTLYC